MAYVYQHIRLDTDEVFYIGIGSDTNGKYKRANKKLGRSEHWNNIVNKAGYKVEILTHNISWDNACEEERRLIKHYGRKDLNEGTLINRTNGGEGSLGIVISEETRQKLKHKIFTDEHRKKISDTLKGRIMSEEFRKRISEVNKGKVFSEETKRKIGESSKGRKHTEESIRKMRESLLLYNKNKKLNKNPPKQHDFF
jgi:hypothetical protein